nr:aldo-keto reductase AKR2E4-like [Maniola hyperantus]
MGLTRSIGVSNFNATEINRILLHSKTPPAVNQIETNPTFTNLELVAYCQSKGIVVTGYAPLGFLVPRSFTDLQLPPTFDDPILVGMAEKYCVEVSQIVLRYLFERCIVPITASLNKEHIESNADIFNFTMSPKDILKMNEFDKNIKVYQVDYDGLELNMRTGFIESGEYVRENNLKQYINTFSVESFKKSETVQLNDGNMMPATAFGTFMTDLDNRPYMPQAVEWAIKAGYRHIDTAALYASEDKIGEALKDLIKRGIVNRTEMYITTKLTFSAATCKEVMQSMRDSLKRLQLQYLDMILIHTPRNVLNIPNRDYLVIWKCLEEAKRMGLTRSIGVSNFNATEINRILLYSKTPPAVNQIETNPTFTSLELVAYCQSKGIVVTGYAPLGFLVPRSFNDVSLPPTFNDPLLVGMAEKYCVEVSQIVLRYLVERCIVPIIASLNKEHIESNVDIFNFTMSPKEILMINNYNKNYKVYLRDYDGLEWKMRTDYTYLIEYIKDNNLIQYRNEISNYKGLKLYLPAGNL